MELWREFLASAPWAKQTPINWLDSALQVQISAARAALPELPLDATGFVCYLAARLPEGVPVSDSLRRVRTADLCLAFCCVHGQAVALRQLDADFLSQVRIRGASAEHREEVLQQLRARLLVAEPGRLSRLAQYRGEGPLLAWLQLSAARIAIEIARKQPSAELQRRAFSDRDLVVDLLNTRITSGKVVPAALAG